MAAPKRAATKHRARRSSPDRQALGLVESAWLFARGDQAVRIVRVGQRHGGTRLLVQGPGASSVAHDFDDRVACALHQSEVERWLLAKRFRLLRFMAPSQPRMAATATSRVNVPDLTPVA